MSTLTFECAVSGVESCPEQAEHLMGNDDSEYKRQLYHLLNEHVDTATRVEEFELGVKPDALTFTLLMEESWAQELAKAGIV